AEGACRILSNHPFKTFYDRKPSTIAVLKNEWLQPQLVQHQLKLITGIRVVAVNNENAFSVLFRT
ncbi:MAG TPA: hypothetical protein VGM32_06285, partial [Rhodopila sp.]